MNRIFSATRLLLLWYASPTGGVYAVSLAVALVSALLLEAPLTPSAGLLLVLGVLIPYKLSREHRDREATIQRVMETIESTASQAASLHDAYLRSVADLTNKHEQSVESARTEWKRILNEERLNLDRSQHDLAKQYESLKKSIKKQEKQTESLRSRLEIAFGTRANGLIQGEVGREIISQLDATKSELRLNIARQASTGAAPNRLLGVVAVQRTGSTWFMDLVRYHPAASLWPTADIYRDLGVGGRRYPDHLSDTEISDLPLELQDGLGGSIPSLHGMRHPAPSSDSITVVEKIHPSAIHFDPDTFLAAVERWSSEYESSVGFVYLLRDPVDSIRSFLSYQARSGSWYSFLERHDVPDFYLRSLHVLRHIFAAIPGPVIAYEDLKARPIELACGIYQRLWPEFGVGRSLSIARDAVRTTATQPRKATQKGPFIATDAEDRPSREEVQSVGDESPSSGTIDACIDITRTLLDSDFRISGPDHSQNEGSASSPP